MPQAGLHSLAALAVRKWIPNKEWLLLGIVLGNPLPDIDNLAVAVATLTGKPTEGLHRTFTHSVFTIVAVAVIFWMLSLAVRKPRWKNLGIGLAIGMSMHVILDLIIWFNGVEIFWPLPTVLNFWSGVTPPDWWMKLMQPAEFLLFGLFFAYLASLAAKQGTDDDYHPRLKRWANAQYVLFVIFTVLVYVMQKGFMTPFGALYLISLGYAFFAILRMRNTIETSVG